MIPRKRTKRSKTAVRTRAHYERMEKIMAAANMEFVIPTWSFAALCIKFGEITFIADDATRLEAPYSTQMDNLPPPLIHKLQTYRKALHCWCDNLAVRTKIKAYWNAPEWRAERAKLGIHSILKPDGALTYPTPCQRRQTIADQAQNARKGLPVIYTRPFAEWEASKPVQAALELRCHSAN